MKKMVLANVAIDIFKEDTKLCGDTCRFIDPEPRCILFGNILRIKGGDLLRCKKCVDLEPIR
jgi:hypothetical protein